MAIPLIESDFRAPFQGLVQVLPGREIEAVNYAQELRREGRADGIFVQGREIASWEFLRYAEGLDRYFFSDVLKSFASVDLSPLARARSISIGGISRPIDFSIFSSLISLGFEWNPRIRNLHWLEQVENVAIWGIGSAANVAEFHLRCGLKELCLVRYGRAELNIFGARNSLSKLSITMARPLSCLPQIEHLVELNLKQVGRHFDYGSIPPTVEDLWIEECAPIEDWSFLESMTSLRRLVVQKNRYSPPSAAVKDLIRGLPNFDVPFPT